jgi:uncharacterized phage protein (TIGR01671 family)
MSDREIKFMAMTPKGMGYVSEMQFHRPWAGMDVDGSIIDVFSPQINVIIGTIESTFDLEAVILRQYTGIKDKNGKEIYDGDIVDFGAGVGQIVWIDECVGFRVNKDLISGAHLWNEYVELKMSEVIGNIYENPQLS